MSHQDRTQKSLDALADLYLTEEVPRPETPMRTSSSGAVVEDGPAITRTPSGISCQELNRRANGKGRRHHGPGSAVGTSPSGDEIAPQQVHVEAVLMGNLPGFGGPWLNQYAHYLAKQYGTVGIVHLEDDQVDIELIPRQEKKVIQTHDDGSRPEGGTNSMISALYSLMTPGQEPIGAWLIHVPTPLTRQSLRVAADLDRWTVLCGADDAAVVGAYRLVKQMVDALEPFSDAQGMDEEISSLDDLEEPQDVLVPERTVGLMMMGSDEPTSVRAAHRIADTAEAFLGLPVQMVGWQKRMVPVYVRILGSYVCETADPWPQLRLFLNRLAESWSNQADPQQTWSVDPDEKLEVLQQFGGGLEDELMLLDAGDQEPSLCDQEHAWLTEDEPSNGSATTQEGQLMSGEPQQAVVDPQDHIEAFTVESSMRRPDLGDFVEPQGVVLDARCPDSPDTVLFLDSQGVMNLLHRVEAGPRDRAQANRGKPVVPEGLLKAMAELVGTRCWVREHLSLLRLTASERPWNLRADPVLHLFTDEVKPAVEVLKRVGDEVRLHLLQKLTVGAESGWVCTDLN